MCDREQKMPITVVYSLTTGTHSGKCCEVIVCQHLECTSQPESKPCSQQRRNENCRAHMGPKWLLAWWDAIHRTHKLQNSVFCSCQRSHMLVSSISTEHTHVQW